MSLLENEIELILCKRKFQFIQILLSKNLQSSSSHNDISVMRFKTYGLYVRSSLSIVAEINDEEVDDGTWCLIEFPLFKDEQFNDICLDIRYDW